MSKANQELESMVCVRCGGTKVIPNCPVQDQGEHSRGRLLTLLGYHQPEAWVFKKAIEAELRATVCCTCGHVDLAVANPSALWDEFQKAPAQSVPD